MWTAIQTLSTARPATSSTPSSTYSSHSLHPSRGLKLLQSWSSQARLTFRPFVTESASTNPCGPVTVHGSFHIGQQHASPEVDRVLSVVRLTLIVDFAGIIPGGEGLFTARFGSSWTNCRLISSDLVTSWTRNPCCTLPRLGYTLRWPRK